jgi:exonuclease SbcC
VALLATADEHDESVRVLEAARRAVAVAPVRGIAVEAEARRAAAERRAHAALEDVGVDRDRLPDLVRERTDSAARVRALLPRAGRIAELTTAAQRLESELADAERGLSEVSARQRETPAAIEVLRARLGEATAARAGREAAQLRLSAVEGRVRAHHEAVEAAGSLEAVRAEWHVARTTAQDLREGLLSIREARLESMAAEIAGALAVGACCPVCGSADHPAKAEPAPGAPDAAAEKAALKAVDDAKVIEYALDVRVRGLEAGIARLREVAGDADVDVLTTERDALEQEVERLAALADRADTLVHEVQEAERTARSDAEAAQRLTVRAAELTRSLEAGAEERDRLAAEVDAELSGTGHGSLTELQAEHDRVAAAGREALAALAGLEAAERARGEAEEALGRAARDAGFDGADAAVGAIRDAGEIDRLAEATAARERRLATLEETLAETGAADETTLPDLADLATGHETALARLGDAQSVVALTSTRLTRLGELAETLHAAVQRWRPIRDELDLTERLAGFVEGKSPDNRLQMRLSAYVLAYRLTQVVAAANARLARMSDRRYSLEHTGRRGAGETRGGLSLLVRDDWSGESRDPATLSGGETFVVSLALALGLADVITQEAGGADLDTLFVDEGFGSLDADTLDDVMDTLDSLRDGGRVVGVVSHVAEMRDRIPTRLTVTKSRRGSTVAVTR